MLDQPVQTAWMDVGRDPPVAQPTRVVTTAGEPAVVEHEALDPDLGGHVDEPQQPAAVVVEVHRFPRVEDHRPRRAGVLRAGPHPLVPRMGGRRQPSRRVDTVHPGRDVRTAWFDRHLPGVQQLAQLHRRSSIAQRLGEHGGVPAPRQVQTPHLARPLPEPGCSGPDDRDRVVGRAPAAVLGDHAGRAVTPRLAPRVELAAPAPAVGHQLSRPRRERHRQRESVE